MNTSSVISAVAANATATDTEAYKARTFNFLSKWVNKTNHRVIVKDGAEVGASYSGPITVINGKLTPEIIALLGGMLYAEGEVEAPAKSETLPTPEQTELLETIAGMLSSNERISPTMAVKMASKVLGRETPFTVEELATAIDTSQKLLGQGRATKEGANDGKIGLYVARARKGDAQTSEATPAPVAAGPSVAKPNAPMPLQVAPEKAAPKSARR